MNLDWKSVAIFILLAGCAQPGADWQHYRISALLEAQDRKMPILLHVDDPKLPNCQKQKTLLKELTRGDRFKKVAAFRVVHGDDVLLEKEYRITKACALLVFQAGQLTTRLEDSVDPNVLKASIERAF